MKKEIFEMSDADCEKGRENVSVKQVVICVFGHYQGSFFPAGPDWPYPELFWNPAKGFWNQTSGNTEFICVGFILLSGFLTVYSASVKSRWNREYSFQNFFNSRFVRIYSVLLPSLLFILAVDFINITLFPSNYDYSSAYNVKTFVSNIFMLQDFPAFAQTALASTSFGSARPLWTLPIEWFLYMVFGFIYFKQYRQTKLRYGLISCLFFLFCVIVPGYNFFMGRGNGLSFTWLFGIVIFFLLEKKADYSKKIAILGFFGMLLLSYGRIVRVYQSFGTAYDPLFSIMLGLCVYFGICLVKDINWNRFAVKAAKTMSGYSFSLYVTHYSLIVLLNNLLLNRINGWLLALIEILLCNILAYLFSLGFERTIPKMLLNRLVYRGKK